jgi:single-strand DNA-binding protein
VLVEGRLNADPASGGPRVYTRQDGSVGSSFEITADTIRFLSSRQEDESYQSSGPMDQMEEDDIPF